jgi:hypothetical protein
MFIPPTPTLHIIISLTIRYDTIRYDTTFFKRTSHPHHFPYDTIRYDTTFFKRTSHPHHFPYDTIRYDILQTYFTSSFPLRYDTIRDDTIRSRMVTMVPPPCERRDGSQHLTASRHSLTRSSNYFNANKAGHNKN